MDAPIAVYCQYCQTWLRDEAQWLDHKISKKHRNNKDKKNAKNIPESGQYARKLVDVASSLPKVCITYSTDGWRFSISGNPIEGTDSATTEAEATFLTAKQLGLTVCQIYVTNSEEAPMVKTEATEWLRTATLEKKSAAARSSTDIEEPDPG